MLIPRVVSMSGAPMNNTEITRHVLSKESELRGEVGTTGTVCVKLFSGNAEVFGVELAEGHTYTFLPGRKFAVYTWYVQNIGHVETFVCAWAH